jgi:hypothetical protein
MIESDDDRRGEVHQQDDGLSGVTPEYELVATTGSHAATGTLSSAQQRRAAVITYQ